jgi:hypothetical protein
MLRLETEKRIASILGNIKSELLTNFGDYDALLFVEWTKKKLVDSIKDNKEKALLSQIRGSKSEEEKRRLIRMKSKYLPPNYPDNLQIKFAS